MLGKERPSKGCSKDMGGPGAAGCVRGSCPEVQDLRAVPSEFQQQSRVHLQPLLR